MSFFKKLFGCKCKKCDKCENKENCNCEEKMKCCEEKETSAPQAKTETQENNPQM